MASSEFQVPEVSRRPSLGWLLIGSGPARVVLCSGNDPLLYPLSYGGGATEL